jgi:hypothetical protein
MRSISIVFEKKRFDSNRILNSKFVVTSKALFAASRREKSEIFDVFFDLWFRIRAQRAKRQRFDDESQIVRKIYLNSIFFFFCDDSLFFIRRSQIVSSNFLDVSRSSFSSSTSRRRHCFSALFISEELDLRKKICSRNEDLYRAQNTLLNLLSVSFNLRNTTKRRRCDEFSSII